MLIAVRGQMPGNVERFGQRRTYPSTATVLKLDDRHTTLIEKPTERHSDCVNEQVLTHALD